MNPLSGPGLGALPGVRHGFFTREGGVSKGLYESLNCGPGSKDEPERVARNRAIAMARLGLDGAPLCTPYQVHGADALVIDAPWPEGQRPRLDALVTRTPRLAIGILTADCAPVLLADGGAGVIGAAHAGWKGALGGILEAAIVAMTSLGARPEQIHAVVGPCIAQRSYEVGPEFPAPFLARNGDDARFFAPGEAGHWQFDLAGYVRARLEAAGLGSVQALGLDTLEDERRFFSYRRTCHRGEADYGRTLSAIALGA